MSGPVRVLALAPYSPRSPSTRYRLDQLAAPLAEVGVHLTLLPFLDEAAEEQVRGGGLGAVRAFARRLPGLRRAVEVAAAHDAVLVQRGFSLLLDGWLLARLRRTGRPLLYDFDDAVYLPQPGGRRWLERLRRPRTTTAAFCRAAARVLAGNDHLADFARRAREPGGAGDVQVVPSVVDTERFRPRAEGPTAPPVVGWIGSDSTVGYLEGLAPAVREIQEETGCRFLVVAGRRRPRLPGVDVTFRSWTPEDEVRRFQELDVGLYPLEDTAWSRGKCGFKAIQYLACGVPCVASPVGVLRELVRPGETGLHARDTEEWVESCVRLLRDPEARRRMGREGRTRVQARYSVPVAVEALSRAVRGAVEQA